jgi:hypothetical protein
MPSSVASLLFLLSLFPPVVSSSSALDFVPHDVFSSGEWLQYRVAVQTLAEANVLQPSYSRHDGAHRTGDHPSGGLLVLPLSQRRVPVAEGFRAHLNAATGLSFLPDARLRATALSDDIQRAVTFSVRRGPSLASFRETVISTVHAVASDLRPLSATLNSLMPPSVSWIAGKVNTVFIAALIDALEWLDTGLVEGFVFGFPVVGFIQDSGVFRPIEPPVSPDVVAARYVDFVRTSPAWARLQFQRLSARSSASTREREADTAVATKTAKEVSRGAMRGPYLSIAALTTLIPLSFHACGHRATPPRPLWHHSEGLHSSHR